MREALLGYVREVLLDQETAASLGPDDELLASGILDSLGMMELVAFIEETLGIEVPPEDVTIERFSTIERIATYLGSRQPQA